jgi:hypothetical protein
LVSRRSSVRRCRFALEDHPFFRLGAVGTMEDSSPGIELGYNSRFPVIRWQARPLGRRQESLPDGKLSARMDTKGNEQWISD